MKPCVPDWEPITTADLGEIVGGGTPSRSVPSFWGGEIPWITPSQVTSLHGKYIDRGDENITADGLAGSAAKLVPTGAVVITTRATLGEAAIAKNPLATNQGFKTIIPNPKTHSDYLYYLAKTWKPRMSCLASGTTFLEISKADFSRIQHSRPNLGEQSRIAAVLDTIDSLIDSSEAVLAKLRQVRAGLLHDLLTRGLDADGQLRDPDAHPEQFQDSPLGRIPREWEVVALRDALDMRSGNSLTGEQIHDAREFPVYGGNGFRGYTGSYTHEGDFVLIGRQGALCGNVSRATGRFFATEHAVVCTPILPISSGWLYCQLDRMNLNRFSESSAQPGLSVKKIGRLQMPLPPLQEQVRAESMLASIDSDIVAEQSELLKLRELKAGLMTDLLEGRVRVPEELIY